MIKIFDKTLDNHVLPAYNEFNIKNRRARVVTEPRFFQRAADCCECGKKHFGEWTCEGEPKERSSRGDGGCPLQQQRMTVRERVRFRQEAKLGGTAEAQLLSYVCRAGLFFTERLKPRILRELI